MPGHCGSASAACGASLPSGPPARYRDPFRRAGPSAVSMPNRKSSIRTTWSTFSLLFACGWLGDGRVIEAQHDCHGPERLVEPPARLIRRILVVNIRPAHADVLVGQAGHGVWELHGRRAVQLEQAAPAKRREDIRQVANGKHGL